jgi:hypothetical protein
MASLLAIAVGVGMALAALVLPRRLLGARIPRTALTAVLGCVVGSASASAFFLLAGPGALPTAPPMDGRQGSGSVRMWHVLTPSLTLKEDAAPTGQASLPVGTRLPALAPEWLNGPPPDLAPGRHGVVVVDVWDDNCPVCRATAPGLVQTHRTYKDRGVTFVSLTPNPKEAALEFVRSCGITWPCQCATPDETLIALAALSRRGNMGTVFSTLYVVRADGTISWSDQRARVRHEDVKTLIHNLQQAIDDALKGT